ncbi:hypothetical protein Pla22_26710 [Rubripirellula amarantea]|uniref:Uncharacterized protein n=1 Tax=Rubripirellula amarantea TaxID=2527999 RepID=A0A5C5WWE3_9BACT|nr:hypothetical protein Pla22_26710 [Rubripirellula amarantea]
MARSRTARLIECTDPQDAADSPTANDANGSLGRTADLAQRLDDVALRPASRPIETAPSNGASLFHMGELGGMMSRGTKHSVVLNT